MDLQFSQNKNVQRSLNMMKLYNKIMKLNDCGCETTVVSINNAELADVSLLNEVKKNMDNCPKPKYLTAFQKPTCTHFCDTFQLPIIKVN